MAVTHRLPVTRRALLLVLAAAGACSTLQVQTDYDPAKAGEIARYRTYAWLPQVVTNDARMNNPIVRDLVVRDVNAELAARGMQEVPLDQADVHLAWGAAVKRKLEVDTIPGYYGYSLGAWYGPTFAYGAPVTRVRQYDEGTLIVDVIDARTNELVWRGFAQAEVDPDSTGLDRAENIRESVHAMFEQYPPP